MMTGYIKGIGSISSQPSFGNEACEFISYNSATLSCIEPDYNNWIDQRAIRRMSKIIRMGVATASLALKEANIQSPNAIVTGTGLGCIQDTEVFLNKLINNNEEAINPTPFIQSTHNTIGSQIALLLQCYGHNQTHTHRALSFEHALLDGLMLLKEHPEYNVLVGGIDEISNSGIEIFRGLGLLSDSIDSLRFFDTNNIGTIHGEGSSFFLISNSPLGAWAKVQGISMIYKPKSALLIQNHIKELLTESNLSFDDIDLILLGKSGDSRFDSLMNEVMDPYSNLTQIPYKNLCGEYSTSTAFAMWLATMILKSRLNLKLKRRDDRLKNILIYNHYFNQHHSLVLVQGCS